MTWASTMRKWSRTIHRDLSYFFSGVLLVYVFSGFMLNHKGDFNSDYSITVHDYRLPDSFPSEKAAVTKDHVVGLLEQWEETGNYAKHYFPKENEIKVFLKGGSLLTADLAQRSVHYESLKKRPVLSALNRLHYNPSRAWTIFSDIFLASMFIIIVSGLVMVKGKYGLIGRGGIELIAGIALPVLFILL